MHIHTQILLVKGDTLTVVQASDNTPVIRVGAVSLMIDWEHAESLQAQMEKLLAVRREWERAAAAAEAAKVVAANAEGAE